MLQILVLLSTLLAGAAFMAAQESGCKCTADNKCWPSKPAWDALSANLTSPVFNVLPLGYYCHDPNYNLRLCDEARNNYLNLSWVAQQPGGSIARNWESNATSSCFVNDERTKPCGQGRVPSVGINATSVKDVEVAMAFAVQHNLKLLVKATGSDYIGRSLGPGAMMIWTYHWKGTTFHPDFFYTGGQWSHVPAITVSPGNQWFEVYKAADEYNVTIGGAIGLNGTVGAGGGFALGAGYSIVAPHVGLAADNLLEVSVVLPNATFVTANAYQNTDLFWAIRGNGGPSFGVVTSMTIKVQPQFPLYGLFFEVIASSSEVYVNLLDSFLSHLLMLGQFGWSGYFSYSGSSNYLGLMYLLRDGNPDAGNFTIGPWINRVQNMTGVTIKTYVTKSYAHFGAWVDANILHQRDVAGLNYAATGLGTGNAVASWLLTARIFSNNTMIHQLSEAMSKIPSGLGQHTGYALGGYDEDFNALHPLWRLAIVNLVAFTEMKYGASQSDVQAAQKSLSDSMAPVRKLTQSCPSAQDLNEPDILVPDFKQANWGTNYARLAFLKKHYDPNNMLLVSQGVGSEGWDNEQVCPKP